jgi:hypothetical protein
MGGACPHATEKNMSYLNSNIQMGQILEEAGTGFQAHTLGAQPGAQSRPIGRFDVFPNF